MLVKELNYAERVKSIRGKGRVEARVPVAVEWTEAGRRLRAEGATMDVSPKGCLAIVPQRLSLGQRLHLVNLENKHVCEAVLIWRGHEMRSGWELGLELVSPALDFWAQ